MTDQLKWKFPKATDIVQCSTCHKLKKGNEVNMLHNRSVITGKYKCLFDCTIKKSGPKKGSGDRTARLEIRCKPELLQVLKLMQQEGWSYQGKSFSDIIHAGVKHLAKLDLVESKDDDVYAAVWKLTNDRSNPSPSSE